MLWRLTRNLPLDFSSSSFPMLHENFLRPTRIFLVSETPIPSYFLSQFATSPHRAHQQERNFLRSTYKVLKLNAVTQQLVTPAKTNWYVKQLADLL